MAMIAMAAWLSMSACLRAYVSDPRTVESSPALFLDGSDLPEGWIVTSPPRKPQTSAYDYAVSIMEPAVEPRYPPGARQEINRFDSEEDAGRHYNGQMNLSLRFAQVPEGFTEYPRQADAYRLGCDPFQAYLHCLYRARYDAYTVDLSVTLNPATAAADLAKMLTAIERRVGGGP
jgi:hypothetical protein